MKGRLVQFLDAREQVIDTCSPEQRLVMAMLVAPEAGPVWGDPSALARDVSWERFSAAMGETLKPYLHWVSQSAPFSSLIPRRVQESLRTARLSAATRNLRWAAELRQITEAFRKEGLSLMLVKGAVLQRTVYPDPSTRPMGDADLVVRRDEMAKVARTLNELGFRPRTPIEQQTPAHGFGADEEAYFYKRIGDRILFVEVHTRLEADASDFRVSTSPLWSLCVDVISADGMQVPTLEAHAALRHLCLHLGYQHGFDGAMLWLLDVRLFLERFGASLRWPEFFDGCEAQARPVIAFTLTLAADWLGARVPEEIRAVVPAEKKQMAISLVWDQIWDYFASRRPPGSFVVLLMSADIRRSWKFIYGRLRRWATPIPGRDASTVALMTGRFWAELKVYRAAIREGGFKISNLLKARRVHERRNRLRAIFAPPRP